MVLLFEIPEVVPDKIVIIVDEYGIDNSGQINETSKIQMALNNISGSDKSLYFPPGKYKTNKLEFRSNSHIHLAKNARLIADEKYLIS